MSKMMFSIVSFLAFFWIAVANAERQDVEVLSLSADKSAAANVPSESQQVPLTPSLQKRLDKVIADFNLTKEKIKGATTKLKEAREKEVQDVVNEGQSEIRKMLEIFRANGEFVGEINQLLTQRQAKLPYKSSDLTEEQRKNLESEEIKLIDGIKNLRERVETVRESLKQVDENFNKTRTYIAALMSQNNVRVAIKAAEDAMSSAEKNISSMDSFVKETKNMSFTVTPE